MKAYTLIHTRMRGIEVGLQAVHSNVEIMRDLEPDTSERDDLISRWATSYKTFAWLDGGNSEQLNDNINIIQESGAPYAYFNEPDLKCSAADVNDAGMLTACTVILTNEQVQTVDVLRRNPGAIRDESPEGYISWLYGMYGACTTPVGKAEAKLIEMIAGLRTKGL